MRTEKNIINIMFDAARGDVSVSSREAESGAQYGALPQPVRRGYTFMGWYLGDTLVSEDMTVTAAEDICLVAKWKKSSVKKNTMLRRQKVAAVALSVTVVVLIVVLLVVNRVVGIYRLTDYYYDENGVEYTEVYRVKKVDGVYGMYDRDGNLMEKSSPTGNIFIAHISKNQYEIDPETGEFKLYAPVDTEDGETEGYDGRVLLYEQIHTENIFSVEVKNEFGSYCFARNEEGTIRLDKIGNSVAGYSRDKFELLGSSCGYTLSMVKLDFTSEKTTAPRLPDGTIDYSAYGLADVYDESGKLVYTPATYTIVSCATDAKGNYIKNQPDPNKSYTVKVGDLSLSGNGYYVQLEGRASVYVLNSMIGSTVLQPVEAMVTPQVFYNMSLATSGMFNNFLISQVNFNGDIHDSKKWTYNDIAKFSYVDLDKRNNTIFNATPYESTMELMEGYNINDSNIGKLSEYLNSMQYVGCKKLGITTEALTECGLTEKGTLISFQSIVGEDEGTGEYLYANNTLLVSAKTEQGTYYIASFLFDMIVEVEEAYMPYMEWEMNEWYFPYFFAHNLAHVTEMTFSFGDDTYHFWMDNSKSDQSETPSSGEIRIFCDRYNSETHELDYELTYYVDSDTGFTRPKKLTAVDNFRHLFVELSSFCIEGDVDREKFANAHNGMSIEEYIAQGDEVCDAIIRYHLEDNASELNPYYKEEGKGNNERDIVIRFYDYSDRHSFITIEVVENYDAQGNPISNPAKASGKFYVLRSYLDKMYADVRNVVSQKRVDTSLKYEE